MKAFQPYELGLSLLAENLLFFDSVVIWLTQVPKLVQVLGLAGFEQALDAGMFHFVDSDAHVLSSYGVDLPTGAASFRTTREIAALNVEQFIRFEKQPANGETARREAVALIDRCSRSRACTFLSGKTDGLGDRLRVETKRDCSKLEVPEYLSRASLSEALFTEQRLFTANLEIAVMQELGARHLVTTPAMNAVHATKFSHRNVFVGEAKERLHSSNTRDILWDLLEIEGIDLHAALQNRDLTVDKLFAIRETRNGARFRGWFSKLLSAEIRPTPQEAREAYFEALRVSRSSGLTSKVLRFAVSTAAGVLNPVAGLVVGAIDSFLVDSLLAGWAPSFFLHDELYAVIAPHIEKRRTGESSAVKGI